MCVLSIYILLSLRLLFGRVCAVVLLCVRVTFVVRAYIEYPIQFSVSRFIRSHTSPTVSWGVRERCFVVVRFITIITI